MSQFKAAVMDGDAVERTLKRIAHEILEKNQGCKDLCLVGICKRGVPMARILAAHIENIEGCRVPVGQLDISQYRDDIGPFSQVTATGATDIPFSVVDKRVVLIDDVLYTGRTARAAIDALIGMGRPACVQLAVLIDRGHRELPIRGDYIGKNLPTSRSERVSVCLPETDGTTGVSLYTV